MTGLAEIGVAVGTAMMAFPMWSLWLAFRNERALPVLASAAISSALLAVALFLSFTSALAFIGAVKRTWMLP